MKNDPVPQHAWLQRLVGRWVYDSECSQGPDLPPLHMSGHENIERFGDLWVVGEMEGGMPDGGRMRGRISLGFDPGRGKFIGTWIGTPMATMFVYEGDLDEGERMLTLNCTGPSFLDPSRTAHYQDIITLNDDGTRSMRSQVKGDDGAWTEFMRMDFKRV